LRHNLEVADELSEADFKAFHRLVQDMALSAYPNPDRIGCPGHAALEEVASLPLSSRHELSQTHINRCSECLRELLAIRRRNYRQMVHLRRKRRILTACAASIILAAGITLMVRRQATSDANHLPDHTSSGDLRASKKTVEPPSTNSASVEVPASIILRPGLSRAAASNESPYELLIHRGTSAVSVILRLDRDTCPMYNAIVQTADGQDARRIEALKAESLPNIGKALVISLPSESLQNNTYQIKILGECRNRPEEFVNIYVFRVIK
jgi:hypothetical protein